MITLVLMTAVAAGPQIDHAESLRVRVSLSTGKIRLGDLLFVQVVVANTGDQPVMAPCSFSRAAGTLRFELRNHEGKSLRLLSEGTGFGPVKTAPIEPGGRIHLVDCLALPPVQNLGDEFWAAGGYDLHASAKVDKKLWLHSPPRQLAIRGRPADELRAIRKLYQLAPPGNFAGYDIPNLGLFGLSRFPPNANKPARLGDLEASLNKGTMLDAVRMTRLLREYRVNGDSRTERAKEIIGYVEKLPDIERQWMADKIVRFGSNTQNKALLELAGQLTPLIPDNIGCAANRREAYSHFIQNRLKHLKPSDK